jgi:hypothetical protein
MRKREVFPSNYLTSEDIPEQGIVVTIDRLEPARMPDGAMKQVMFFAEREKGMILNVTKWNVMERLYGEESDDWIGERITLYPGETPFEGELRPCINIKNKKPAAEPKKAPEPNVKKGAKPTPATTKVTPMTQAEIDEVDSIPDDGPPY